MCDHTLRHGRCLPLACFSGREPSAAPFVRPIPRSWLLPWGLLPLGILILLAGCQRSDSGTSGDASQARGSAYSADARRAALLDELARREEAVQDHPDDPQVYIERGIVRRRLGWYQKSGPQVHLYANALQDFRTAHEKAGGQWTFDVSIADPGKPGQAFGDEEHSPTRAGKPSRGAPGDHTARSTGGGSALALLEAARLFELLYSYEQAATLVRAAAELAPQNPTVKVELARLSGFSDGNWVRVARELGAFRDESSQYEPARLSFNLGFAYHMAGQLTEAASGYQRAIELDPDQPSWRAELALVRARLAGELTPQREADLGWAHTDPLTVNGRAGQLIRYGRPWDAITILKASLKHSRSSPAWLTMGRAYREIGDHENALQAFRNAAQLDPAYSGSVVQIGRTLLDLGRYDEARAVLEGLVKQASDSSSAWFYYGDALRLVGQPRDAERAYRQATRLRPDHASAWYRLGVLRWCRNSYDEALYALQEALRGQPRHAEAHYALACLQAAEDRPADAERLFQQAFELDPNGYALDNLCQILKQGGHDAQLLGLLDQVIVATPGQAAAHAWRASEHMARDRYDRALDDYGTFLKLAPNNRAYFQRALLRLITGQDRQTALADLRAALQLAPDDSITSLFTWMLEKEGGHDEAAKRVIAAAVESSLPSDWFGQIARYYHGDLTRQELLAEAQDEGRRCEAYYYIAEKVRVEEGHDAATVWFRKCIDQGMTEYTEDRLARWRLEEH